MLDLVPQFVWVIGWWDCLIVSFIFKSMVLHVSFFDTDLVLCVAAWCEVSLVITAWLDLVRALRWV